MRAAPYHGDSGAHQSNAERQQPAIAKRRGRLSRLGKTCGYPSRPQRQDREAGENSSSHLETPLLSAAAGVASASSLSDLEACSDQRERAMEMTLAAGPLLNHAGDDVRRYPDSTHDSPLATVYTCLAQMSKNPSAALYVSPPTL